MLNENFDEHWKNDFRITRNTFLEIVRIVQAVMEKRDTQLRRAVPIEKRVAIAVWRLLEIHSVQQQRHLLLENQ